MPQFDDVHEQFDIRDEDLAAALSPPDLKGRINLRIEQRLQQELEDIAEDNDYPLRSVSQVVRYCCMIGLERLREWKPKPTLLGAIKAANALAVRDKIQSETTDLMDRLEERVTWHIDNGSYDEAINLVGNVRSHFESVPQDWWRDRSIADIDRKFEEWLTRIDQRRQTETDAR